MESGSKYATSNKIKSAIMGTNAISFTKFAEKSNEHLKLLGKIGMYNNATGMLTKLNAFNKNKVIQFYDITPTFLKNFEDHMRLIDLNNQNTIANNMKILRKIYNDAIREELIPNEQNPFHIYKIKWGTSEKSYLTEEELEAFYNCPVDPTKISFHFRNLYVFAAYTGGIRISDLLMLKWSNFDGVNLSLVTKKTKTQISIYVPKRAIEILNLYKTPDKQPTDYIFPFLKSYKDYSEPLDLFNAISTYTCRANSAL